MVGWRRLGVVLSVALVSVGIAGVFGTGASSALFTTQVTNPTNTFVAGTLKISNSRDGVAVFLAGSGAIGPVLPNTSATVASGTLAFAGLGIDAAASPAMTVALGQSGVLAPAQSVTGTGGVAPGTILVNSLTIGNSGTLSAGSVTLSVPSATVTNWPSASCDASTALVVVGSGDVCGRGRLTDVLRLTAWYETGDGQAMCVLGANRGGLVPAPTPSATYMGCAGSGGLGDPVTVGDAGPTLPLAPSSDPDGKVVTVSAGLSSGARIAPLLSQGVLVKNVRAGVPVNDWSPNQYRAITIAVAFDPSADNRYAGAQASVDLVWKSVSLSGAPTGATPN